MTDLALSWDNLRQRADLSISGADLAADNGLTTAVILSLFLRRRAQPSDVLPDDTVGPFGLANHGSGDRGGWWGDWYAPTAIDTLRAKGVLTAVIAPGQLPSPAPADLNGCRWWLLQRAKATAENVALAKDYGAEALQWLVDDGVAASVTVTAKDDGKGRLVPHVEIARPKGDLVSFAFAALWDAMAAPPPPPQSQAGTLDFSTPENSGLIGVVFP
jgi:phage gp46-like protein